MEKMVYITYMTLYIKTVFTNGMKREIRIHSPSYIKEDKSIKWVVYIIFLLSMISYIIMEISSIN